MSIRPDTTRSDGRRHANGAQAAPLLLPVAADALAPLIAAVVEATIRRVEAARSALPDKLAFTEAEAARLLSLNPWQLRGERRLGRVRATAGPGGKILYTREALLDYLASRPWEGVQMAIGRLTPTGGHLALCLVVLAFVSLHTLQLRGEKPGGDSGAGLHGPGPGLPALPEPAARDL